MNSPVDCAPREIPITTGGAVQLPAGITLRAARLSLIARGLLLTVDERGRFVAERLH